ncbi:cuticle protein 16.8-like [Limulus polyphemus]|uniref:Cuticle protein 16.8-like n=1 Tax=Limulus polyphemus TaxID=6850 RepID=A0ABM1BIM8_LIMPO|nr:cuticle protein 16.8-like [Limulus polyphemus]
MLVKVVVFVLMSTVSITALPAEYKSYGQFTSREHVRPIRPLETHGLIQIYSYGYRIKDEYGNVQFRKEESEGKGNVKGSYGYTDASGLYRLVEYVADAGGFRATVKTNEPGTTNQNPADVKIISEHEKRPEEEHNVHKEVRLPLHDYQTSPNYFHPTYGSAAKEIPIQGNVPRYTSIYTAPALASTSAETPENLEE